MFGVKNPRNNIKKIFNLHEDRIANHNIQQLAKSINVR